jgi:protein-tyrosine phosphatase
VIDVHHHCLPAVDDGPRDLAESIELCRLALEDGIDTIVATPHVLRGRWNESRARLDEAIAELRAAVGDAPKLLLGSEYFFAHDVTEVLQRGDAIVPLAGSRYVLIEFATHAIPPLVEQPLYRMQLEGWIPLIAHPERNVVFQSKPELLSSLVELGTKVQITAGSFTGDFGAEAEQAARAYLKRGLVHVIASDAHNVKRRPPRMRAARAIVTELAGERVAEALFEENPRAIIENRSLVYEPDIPYTSVARQGLFGRLRRLWER